MSLIEIYWTKQLNCFFADGQINLCSTDSTGSPGSSSHHRASRLVPGMFQLWAFKLWSSGGIVTRSSFSVQFWRRSPDITRILCSLGPGSEGRFFVQFWGFGQVPFLMIPMDPSGSPRSRWIWPYLTRQQQVLPHVQVGIPGLELGHGDRTTCDMGMWQNVVKKC